MNGDVIHLQFPARPEYMLVVRLAVSAVAERVGFDIEDIEDIKVASAEACTLLLATGASQIDISLAVDAGLMLNFKTFGDLDGGAEEIDSMSLYLLDALVDTCELESDGGVIRGIHLEKRLLL